MSDRQVLALGIDGANTELIRRWAADGTLPNIARLMARGASGTSLGLRHFFVGATWPSLYTGTSPAEHGHHSLIQLRPGTYDYYRMAEGEIVARTPFWDVLSQAGRRVAILDVPLSQLSPALNGLQTVEWGSHDAVYGFRASTPSLEREILVRFGTHPLGPNCDGAHRTAADYDQFISRLLAGVERKTELTRALLARGPWDFFMQVFTESHCVGHQCWHLHDASHPAHDPAVADVTGDPLRRIYRAIDEGLGRILADAEQDMTVVVFSAHSMGYWYGAQLLLPEILFRLGVSVPAKPLDGARRSVDPILDLAAWGWRRLPRRFRERLKPLRERVLIAAQGAERPPRLGVDPINSFCFPVYSGLVEGGIRLNLAGREPAGQLMRRAEADRFCGELRDALLAITDERTGGPLIRDVVRTKDVVHGTRLDALPDLLVVWSDDVPTGSASVGDGRAATIRANSLRIGTVDATNTYGRTGEHRPDGFCIFAGPNIEAGGLPTDFSLLDYAPTFAAMLGVEMPTVDGRVAEKLV